MPCLLKTFRGIEQQLKTRARPMAPMQSYCIIHPQSQLDSKFQYDSTQVKIEVGCPGMQGWLVRMQFRLRCFEWFSSKKCIGCFTGLAASFELMLKFHHLSLHWMLWSWLQRWKWIKMPNSQRCSWQVPSSDSSGDPYDDSGMSAGTAPKGWKQEVCPVRSQVPVYCNGNKSSIHFKLPKNKTISLWSRTHICHICIYIYIRTYKYYIYIYICVCRCRVCVVYPSPQITHKCSSK